MSDEPATTLLDALEGAKVEDLESLDKRILDLRVQLDTMQCLRRVLQAKFNLRERKKPGPRKSKGPGVAENGDGNHDGATAGRGAITAQYREKVGKYLAHQGIGRANSLAEACGIPLGSMTAVMDYFWFKQTPQGYALSEDGKRRFG